MLDGIDPPLAAQKHSWRIGVHCNRSLQSHIGWQCTTSKVPISASPAHLHSIHLWYILPDNLHPANFLLHPLSIFHACVLLPTSLLLMAILWHTQDHWSLLYPCPPLLNDTSHIDSDISILAEEEFLWPSRFDKGTQLLTWQNFWGLKWPNKKMLNQDGKPILKQSLKLELEEYKKTS